jgi:arylsulfatase A-like enzyme
VGIGWGGLLFAWSLKGFALKGVEVPLDQVIEHYFGLIVSSLIFQLLLLVTACAAVTVLALTGLLVIAGVRRHSLPPSLGTHSIIAVLAVPVVLGWRLASLLQSEPSTVLSQWPFDDSRLYWPTIVATSSLFEPIQSWLPPLVVFVMTTIGLVTLAGWRARWLRRWHSGAIAGSLLLLSIGVSRSPADVSGIPHQSLPNIVILASDSLRPDRLGSYGYPWARTPHIDALARKGIVFDQTYVPLSRTHVSMVSLFTGMYPHHHGVRETWWTSDSVFPGIGNYVDVFNRAGYHTAVVTDWAATDLRDRGFEFASFDAPSGAWNVRTFIRRGTPQLVLTLSLLLPERLFWSLAPELAYSPGRYAGRQMLDGLRDEIETADRKGRPFFIFSFASTTHGPVATTGAHLRTALRRVAPDTPIADNWTLGYGARTIKEAVDIVAESGATRPKDLFDAVYDAAVSTFDDDVGAALRLLGDRETIVVIWSDHGISLFENRTYGMGNWLGHDIENRVPFIIYDPRKSQAQRIPQVISGVDVLPTVAGLVGLKADWPTDGVDRLGAPPAVKPSAFMETGIWLNKPSWSDRKQPTILEMVYIPWELGMITLKPRYREISLLERHRAIRTDRYRLVMMPRAGESARYLLYDLSQPTFLPELARTHPAFLELRDRLTQWIVEDPLVRVHDDQVTLALARD